jgi:hypothetical protein
MLRPVAAAASSSISDAPPSTSTRVCGRPWSRSIKNRAICTLSFVGVLVFTRMAFRS